MSIKCDIIFVLLCFRVCLFIEWSPAGKGLTSWLLFVMSNCEVVTFPFGLGAKSQILSSVAPPRKKKLVTIFSQEHVWGPQKPMFY